MAARSKARRRALDILFEAELRGADPVEILSERERAAEPPLNPYSGELVRGVQANREHIDEIIAGHAEGWTIARMPVVDRAALRLGVYELLWGADVPDAVAIDEAVELVKALSTDESPRFVNGVLGRVLRERPPHTVGTG